MIGYDGDTIYRVYLENHRKIIWIKDVRIFEDDENKLSIDLSDYSEGTPTFQGFLLIDNDDKQLEADLHLTRVGQNAVDAEANQSSPSRNKRRKVNEGEPIPSKVITPISRDRKIVDNESRESAINISRG